MYVYTIQIPQNNIHTPLVEGIEVSQEPSIIGDNQSMPYIPTMGQIFKTHDKAHVAYMEYIGRVGFDVRMVTTKVIDGVLSQRRMVCAKQGVYSPMDQDPNAILRKKRRIRNSRCGCDSMFYMVLDNNWKSWCVVSFVEQHNHDMVSLSKRKYLQVN